MSDRTQPVCHGVDEKGELVWVHVAMPRWLAAMFPKPYRGDFKRFWDRLYLSQSLDWDMDCTEPICDLTDPNWNKVKERQRRKRWTHSGD